MTDVVFEAGEKAYCRCADSYSFTEGKEYVIEAYEPPFQDPTSSSGFIWPAYVRVKNDRGTISHCHAWRFVKEKADATCTI